MNFVKDIVEEVPHLVRGLHVPSELRERPERHVKDSKAPAAPAEWGAKKPMDDRQRHRVTQSVPDNAQRRVQGGGFPPNMGRIAAANRRV